MNDLVPFVFPPTNRPVRFHVRDGLAWPVLVDLCRELGIKNSRNVVARLPDDAVHSMDGIVDALGRPQSVTIVHPYRGLPRVVMGSRSPLRDRLEAWIFDEVLPQIFETGGYGTASPPTDPLALAHHALTVISSALAIAEPKAKEYDAYQDSKGLHTLAQAAQLFCYTSGEPLGRTRFVDKLRALNILCKPAPGEGPRPIQKYVERYWFELHPKDYMRGGRRVSYMQTFVTPKGVHECWRVLVNSGEDLIEPDLGGQG